MHGDHATLAYMGDATPKDTTTTSLQRIAHGYTELAEIITASRAMLYARAHRDAAAIRQGKVF